MESRPEIHSVPGSSTNGHRAHLARAVLDSIAHQTVDVMRAMEADAGVPIAQLRVDGGATVNDLLMQYQSDILGCEVVRRRHFGTAFEAVQQIANVDLVESSQKQPRSSGTCGTRGTRGAGARQRQAGRSPPRRRWRSAVGGDAHQETRRDIRSPLPSDARSSERILLQKLFVSGF